MRELVRQTRRQRQPEAEKATCADAVRCHSSNSCGKSISLGGRGVAADLSAPGRPLMLRDCADA